MREATDDTACKLTAVRSAQVRQERKGQWVSHRPGALLLVAGAYLVGGSGMLAWLVFMLLGAPALVDVGTGMPAKLLIDMGLCLVFFVQHSLMVRRRFRLWLTLRVHADFHGALYATAAGACLLLLVGLWQPVGPVLWHPPGWLRGVFWSVFIASGLAAGWGVRSLGEFDALGVKPALAAIRREGVSETPRFVIRGPYRWVRHPLYLFSLIIIWAGPVFTIDRIVHNLFWTIWVVIGATMEERDLAACFGDAYRAYQNQVPMLIPRGIRPSAADNGQHRTGGSDVLSE